MCSKSYSTYLLDQKWLISGLDINIFNSDLEYIHFSIQRGPNRIAKNPKTTIENSLFWGLDLQSGTETYINGCQLDGRGRKSPLITAEGASVTVTCSEFDNFKSMEGASILHGKYGTKVSIKNSSFHNNQALYGIVFLHGNCSISMSSVQVYSFRSYHYGLSAFIFWESVTCLIEDSEFIENRGLFGSAIAGIDNTVIKSINNTFTGNQAGQGGALAIVGNSSLHIFNNTFMRNKADPDQRFVKDSELFVKSYLTSFSLFIEEEGLDRCLGLSMGGAIVAKRQSNITLESSSFIENSAEWGGAIYLKRAISAVVINTTFKNNFAHYGGSVLADDQVVLTIERSRFLTNDAEESGGAITIADHSTAEIVDSNFANNRAGTSGGAIVLNVFSGLTLFGCKLIGNNAEQAGGIRVGNNSKIWLNNSSFHKNYAKSYGGVLLSLGTNTITFNNSVFTENQAKYGGVFTIVDNSTFYVLASNFTENMAVDGGIFYIFAQVIGNITGSSFIKNEAEDGGVFWAENQVEIYIEKSNFQKNVGKLHGAAVFCFNNTGFFLYHHFFKTGSSDSKDGTIISNEYSVKIETCNFYYILKESFNFYDDLILNTDDKCYFIGDGNGNISLC